MELYRKCMYVSLISHPTMAIAGSPNNPRSLWIEQPPQVFTPAFTFKHPQ